MYKVCINKTNKKGIFNFLFVVIFLYLDTQTCDVYFSPLLCAAVQCLIDIVNATSFHLEMCIKERQK